MPGRPDQNGRHERMHRTLKAETASPPQPTFAAQQVAFDEFRHDFNQKRLHEALGQIAPAKVYTASTREYTGELVDPEYPDHFHVQRACPNGVIIFGQTQWYLSGCLANQRIGIEPVTDGCWRVHFGPVPLGLIDLRTSVKRNARRFGQLVKLHEDQRRRRRPRRCHPCLRSKASPMSSAARMSADDIGESPDERGRRACAWESCARTRHAGGRRHAQPGRSRGAVAVGGGATHTTQPPSARASARAVAMLRRCPRGHDHATLGPHIRSRATVRSCTSVWRGSRS